MLLGDKNIIITRPENIIKIGSISEIQTNWVVFAGPVSRTGKKKLKLN